MQNTQFLEKKIFFEKSIINCASKTFNSLSVEIKVLKEMDSFFEIFFYIFCLQTLPKCLVTMGILFMCQLLCHGCFGAATAKKQIETRAVVKLL